MLNKNKLAIILSCTLSTLSCSETEKTYNTVDMENIDVDEYDNATVKQISVAEAAKISNIIQIGTTKKITGGYIEYTSYCNSTKVEYKIFDIPTSSIKKEILEVTAKHCFDYNYKGFDIVALEKLQNINKKALDYGVEEIVYDVKGNNNTNVLEISDYTIKTIGNNKITIIGCMLHEIEENKKICYSITGNIKLEDGLATMFLKTEKQIELLEAAGRLNNINTDGSLSTFSGAAALDHNGKIIGIVNTNTDIKDGYSIMIIQNLPIVDENGVYRTGKIN